MKNISILLFILFFGFYARVSAQVEVNALGQTVIGSGKPNFIESITNGGAEFRCLPAHSSIRIQNYHNYDTLAAKWYDDPAIDAFWGNSAWLGNYERPFFRVYSWKIFAKNSLYIYSDVNLKENVKNIASVSEKFKRIQPITYDYKMEFYGDVPEHRKAELESGSGYLSVDYIGFIPIMVKQINDQQSQIDALKLEVEQLRTDLSKIKKN